jgi:hypothetical protein
MKTNIELFNQTYAATHEAADLLSKMTDKDGMFTAQAGRIEMSEINRLLRLASCAATTLESRLAGNPPPKEG